MADRGRDLKIGILSDAAKFDLSDPADQLEEVGDNAKSMGADVDQATDELKRLAAQGADAQRELDRLNTEVRNSDVDRLGKDAKDTAAKVDASFEKIAASSKANLAKVDAAAKDAGQGLDGFKEEAGQSGREAAASFSGGFDDVTGFVQETAAQAFGGFGALGQAAGVAGAIGVGIIGTAITAAKERVKELSNAFRDVSIDGGNFGDTVRVVLDDLKDSGDLAKLAADAKLLGINWGSLVRAMAGSDSDIAAVNKAMDDLSASGMVDHVNFNEAANSFDNIGTAIGRSGAAMSDATSAATAYAHGIAAAQVETEAAKQAEDDRQAALEETTALLEEVGAAEKARADGTALSIDEVIAKQKEEIAAKRDFLTNTKEVLTEVGQAGVDWANSFGPLAPQMMAELAKAPKAKQAEIVANYTQIGTLAGESTADALAAQGAAVAQSAVTLHAKADATLTALGALGIKVGIAGQDIPAAAREAWIEADRYFQRHPVTIRTKVTGSKPIRDVQ